MMVDGQPQFAGLYSHPVADFYESEYVDHVEILRGPGSVLYGSYNTWQNSLAKGYRNPSFRELYLYIMAYPELNPENMMNYELTIGKHFSRYLSLDVTGYFPRLAT